MNGTNTDEVYLFLCFGKSYIDDSLDLVKTLRINNDTREINIVVLPEDLEYAFSKRAFNHILSFNPKKDPLFKLCKNNFEKFCLLPRLRINTFIQNKFTLILDVDILCSYSTNEVWDFLKIQNQTVSMLGSVYNPKWHWGYWKMVCDKIKINYYETHGGLFFINNNKDINLFFSYAEEAFINYDKLGMIRLYQNGAVDEPCFSYAFSKMNYQPINFGDFPIMTFNLNTTDDIPTKKLTEERQGKIMEDYIPFIHMFSKNKSPEFISIKEKILNKQ
jgi:hypothetical protein